jgi:hypothetical protein
MCGAYEQTEQREDERQRSTKLHPRTALGIKRNRYTRFYCVL